MWFSGSAAEDGVISVSTSRLREPVPPSSHFLQPPSLQGFGDPSTSLELPSTMWHCVPIAHVICVPFAHAIHRLTQPRNVHRAKGLQAFFGTHVECGYNAFITVVCSPRAGLCHCELLPRDPRPPREQHADACCRRKPLPHRRRCCPCSDSTRSESGSLCALTWTRGKRDRADTSRPSSGRAGLRCSTSARAAPGGSPAKRGQNTGWTRMYGRRRESSSRDAEPRRRRVRTKSQVPRWGYLLGGPAPGWPPPPAPPSSTCHPHVLPCE